MPMADALVLGGGPAGLTAGTFLARHGRSTLIVDRFVGNHLINAGSVENYPGFPEGIGGADLAARLQAQAAAAGAQFAAATVEAVGTEDGEFTVTTDDGEHRARSLVVCTGSRLRRLGVDGEERWDGNGISECATCDGPLFRGQPVAVVGDGDSALDEALALTGFASSVTLIHRGPALAGQQALRDRVAADDGIRTRPETSVVGFDGEDRLTGVVVRDAAGRESVEPAAGAFVFIGLEPNTTFLRGVVELDEADRVIVDASLATSVPGIFAAGDVRRDSSAQFISAAGDGATAALTAHRFLG
jgi:thioredoxin reductase (NADPH)